MKKHTKKSVASVLFLFIALHFLCIETSYSMDDHVENVERKWRQSLDVYDHTGDHILHHVDNWLITTFNVINEDNEKNIRSKCEKSTSVEQNIAAAKFTIIGEVEDKIQIFEFDLEKIFVSGLNALNEKDPNVIADHLLEKVIFPISFIKGKRPAGQEINKKLREQVNLILGKNIVEAGTHSEESIVITINNNLHHYINMAAGGKPMKILGIILEISSLKDPCSDVCVPMLKAFMENIHVVLGKNLIKGVKIAQKLENLVLLSGRKSHNSQGVDSRTGMIIVNEKIKLNFNAPSNRIFSIKSD